MSEFSVSVKKLIRLRDSDACFLCGGVANNIHHRMSRGAGGSRSAAVSSAANGIVLCGSGVMGCHGFVESNRALSYRNGWLVRRNCVQAPSEVGIFSPLRGDWLLLDNSGGFVVTDSPV